MVNFKRLLFAGLAAGLWVVISGMLMASLFGYGEMKAAFDAIGLAIPSGTDSLVLHTSIRLTLGFAIAAQFTIFLKTFAPGRAMLVAAGFTWLLAVLLPYAVIADWGLLSWSLTAKLWAWGAAEFFVAGVIVQLIYRR